MLFVSTMRRQGEEHVFVRVSVKMGLGIISLSYYIQWYIWNVQAYDKISDWRLVLNVGICRISQLQHSGLSDR